jgi:integration host factor subunit beta
MKAYTRNDLADDLADKLKVSVSQSKLVVSFVIDRLTQAMAGGRKVEFRGFGIFVPQVRKGKVGRNPKHPENGTYTIPARRVVRFRVGKKLDLKLNSA